MIEANSLNEVMNHLASSFGTPGRVTSRAIGPEEVKTAYLWMAGATDRVRVYSQEPGDPLYFYNSRQVQYVEVVRQPDGEWVWSTGWSSPRTEPPVDLIY